MLGSGRARDWVHQSLLIDRRTLCAALTTIDDQEHSYYFATIRIAITSPGNDINDAGIIKFPQGGRQCLLSIGRSLDSSPGRRHSDTKSHQNLLRSVLVNEKKSRRYISVAGTRL
ncbi:hypothetical protein M378DRAFT_1002780 [Amanita muscaria Koide BX008]|uniref:Uncharacterized protein n=1 Tax=Amanita muscaria (strain Koide BX008) TaxID=946122 RepID=A0A0C2WT78_AMAMK|nr:hypothetical protein M378DRAFT_1002780 [Amanita muscaria Koide BX008]